MDEKEALVKWKEYDQTFADPMDDMEIKKGDNFREARQEIESDPIPKMEGWGRTAEFTIVGNNPEPTDKRCGKFWGFKGCLNVELHGHISLDGVNHKGNVYWRKRYHSCDRPECPVCYASGWAVKEAHAIDYRIKMLSQGYVQKAYRDKKGRFHPEIRHAPMGEPQHVIVSVPSTDFGLKFGSLKKKLLKVLFSRGVLGGVHIFHAFRYRNWLEAQRSRQPQGWYFSPHFHVIGFIDGGYGQCRRCKNVWIDDRGQVNVIETSVCLACKGFEGRTRRQYAIETEAYRKRYGVDFDEFGNKKPVGGYIVKVGGKRKTVYGTAWYQLNHSTLIKGQERVHVATWFGTCSYSKAKLEKGDRKKQVCPICGYELEEILYVGSSEGDH